MAFITRLSQLFSQSESSDVLGVSLRQREVDYCVLDSTQQAVCGSQLLIDGNYTGALSLLAKKSETAGKSHIILSAKQNQIVQIDKPQVPEAEINAAVKWQIKDLVSIAPDDMIVDYFDGPKLAGGIEKINVVCANKHDLSAFVAELNEHNVPVNTISIEEFAFASLMPLQSDAKLMVCKQPGEDLLLLIVKEGGLYFHRRIRGLEQIEGKSQEELDLTVIDSLSLEIQRSADYFERQLKQAPIRSIEILLPMEHEAFLARRLSENTNVPVNIFDMPTGLKEQRAFAVCIGATRLAQAEEA